MWVASDEESICLGPQLALTKIKGSKTSFGGFPPWSTLAWVTPYSGAGLNQYGQNVLRCSGLHKAAADGRRVPSYRWPWFKYCYCSICWLSLLVALLGSKQSIYNDWSNRSLTCGLNHFFINLFCLAVHDSRCWQCYLCVTKHFVLLLVKICSPSPPNCIPVLILVILKSSACWTLYLFGSWVGPGGLEVNVDFFEKPIILSPLLESMCPSVEKCLTH